MKIFYKLQDLKMRAKHAWQRAFRGYDDSVYWSLYSYITEIALPVLKWYRDNKSGIPIVGSNELPFEEQKELWNIELDKMIEAFQLIDNDDGEAYTDEGNKKIEAGLGSFARYFRGLWD